jgi:hypothetical protein
VKTATASSAETKKIFLNMNDLSEHAKGNVSRTPNNGSRRDHLLAGNDATTVPEAENRARGLGIL